MQYLTDFHARLAAFRDEALVDMSAQAAALFVQPVALTRRLADTLTTDDARLEVVSAAYRELVAVAGKETTKTAHTLFFEVPGHKLQLNFTFARSQEAGAAIPTVTIGYRDEF